MPDDIRMVLEIKEQLDELRKRDVPVVNYGTANPSSYPTNVPFYRTDIGVWIYYDGTQWLSTQEFICTVGYWDNLAASYAATTATVRSGLIRSEYKIYLTRGKMQYLTGATNTGVSYMAYTFALASGTTIWTFDSSAQAANTSINVNTTTFAAQPAAAENRINLNMTITGAPSAQFPRQPLIWYRLVVT